AAITTEVRYNIRRQAARMKAQHLRYRRITHFSVGDKVSVLISKPIRAKLHGINGRNRLICQIISITKHQAPRYELVSEHGTLDRLFAGNDMMPVEASIPFTPVESTKKIAL